MGFSNFCSKMSWCQRRHRHIGVRVGFKDSVDAERCNVIKVFVSVCGAVSVRVCSVELSCIVRRTAACGPNYLVSGHCVSKKTTTATTATPHRDAENQRNTRTNSCYLELQKEESQ